MGIYLTLNFSFHYIFHINFGWSHSDYCANSAAAAAVAVTGTEFRVRVLCGMYVCVVLFFRTFFPIKNLYCRSHTLQYILLYTWCAFVCCCFNKRAFDFMHVTVIDVSACVFLHYPHLFLFCHIKSEIRNIRSQSASQPAMPYTYTLHTRTHTHTLTQYSPTNGCYCYWFGGTLISNTPQYTHIHNMDIHMHEGSYCARRAHTSNCCCMLLSSNRCFNDVDYFRIELVVAILISYEHDTHVNLFA